MERKEAVRLYFEELLNRQDVAVADEILTEDVTFDGAAEVQGRDAFKEFVPTIRHAFPDVEFSLERVIEEGDDVCAVITMRGTHGGPLFGIEPTGKRFEVPAVDLMRFRDGRIADIKVVMNVAALLGQIGVRELP